MKYLHIFILVCVVSAHSPALSQDFQTNQFRDSIRLDGEWQFMLGTLGIGEQQKWFLADLDDSVELPGTTDQNEKGFLNTDTTTMHLNRVYAYEGNAWYRKAVTIPENFKSKELHLFLERTKISKIWIDSIFIGGSQLLQSPQVFNVSDYLTPGVHHITIQVNNDLNLTPYGGVHIYSEHTQTNWNGILGEMYIEASPETYISNLRVFPDVDSRKIEIEMAIVNKLGFENLDIELMVEKIVDGKTTQLRTQTTKAEVQDKIILEYDFGDDCRLWDEYAQPLYSLTAIISNGDMKDAKAVSFGMRKFETNGTQFSINDRTVFLRGKHEAAVFPLTGYPPMDVDDWVRVYRIAKSYGINHYRFHSYCPPEAAFIAADREGIYLEAELPFWGGLESDSTAQMLRDEGLAMLRAYANHPSFVMFSHGNEIWSGHDRVDENIEAFKAYDNRPLYTMGCNNNIGYLPPSEHSDFFVGARTPYDHDTTLTHTRLTHAFVDSRDGGILNTQTPSTEVNYDYPVSQMEIPIISHEIGQYQIYPDYAEINKYTGVLRAWNLSVFQDRLEQAGMAHLDSAFHEASGAWSALCYKAEMEAALRTEGFGGFRLLDLQDYPGQGTALVGILDAFMESKNVVSREVWRQSCNDVVLLLEFQKYCWKTNEDFFAKAVVANYSQNTIDRAPVWEVRTQAGAILQNGAFTDSEISNGGLTNIGELSIDLASIRTTEKLIISVSIPGTNYSNTYPIWIYPSTMQVKIPGDILVVTEFSDHVRDQLRYGGKVLFFPQMEDVQDHSYPGLFPPDFWNYGMFKGISESNDKPVSPGTLGILTNPDHPIFNTFPTEYHTNWQWFSIIKASNSLILDDMSDDYYPTVQVIDNLERNHKLGLIFELQVESGQLLVCMAQLNRLQDKPEAVQLYQSLLNYMDSDDFDPQYLVTTDELNGLFSK